VKVKAICTSCGRGKEYPAEVLARHPACIYCGAAMTMDQQSRESVQQARATQLAAGAPLQGTCPLCVRSRRVKFGEEIQCTYCGGLYVMYAEGAAGLPGPAGTVFQAQASAQALEIRPKVAEKLRAAVAGQEALPTAALAPVIAAVSWRYTHGNVTAEELGALAGLLGGALRWRQGALPADRSALPAGDTAEVVAQSICRDYRTATEMLPDGRAVARITTDQHTVSRTEGNAMVIGAAVGGLPGALVGAAMAQKGEHEVRHDLRVDLTPEPEGCALGFSGQWSTGEDQPMDEKQQALRHSILAALPGHGEQLAVLRAVYGTWFRPLSMVSLRRPALAARLAALGPGLEALLVLAPE